MDRRQRKTREAIYRAFTALLREEGYAKVTVQQIIDRADIGRTTFYTHFDTKDALLRSFCSEIFDHVFSVDPGKKKTHDFSNAHDIKAKVTHILYHLREHIDVLSGILSGESDAVFMGFFREKLAEMFSSSVPKDPAVPYDYRLNGVVCGFCETVRWWTKHSGYTPEEISDFFFAAMAITA